MATVLTVRLDDELEEELDRACERSGKSRSEMVRDALRRQIRLSEFLAMRQEIMPFAEAAGWLTDEDVFRDVS
ncbi:MAG TPA: YlcI/YnfO family protein [Longimicrobium sp.]|jgi:metal-responsive CopG/Arc/MetJ family transcriptional regulator|uniref:YlcI/YnfO family protein n=1 Tax=Longimicrobium sp. TaxID=2029185 RepID=UPI002EDB6D41